MAWVPAVLNFEGESAVRVGEDFDQLVLIEELDDAGVGHPFDGARVESAHLQLKEDPLDETVLVTALVQPFQGNVTLADGSVVTYVLADGRYRVYIDHEALEVLQSDKLESGSLDLFFVITAGSSTQRIKPAAGRWVRILRTTEDIG